MAQLTSDIVWLVEQSVTLPDGSVQKVLVPQLYVRVKEGDINGAGALLAGDSVDLKFTGDVINSGGTIAGRQALKIDADNIHNLAGGRITGQDVALNARTDLNNIGATIDAGNSLGAKAGRDINIQSTTSGAKKSATDLAKGLGVMLAAGGVADAAVALNSNLPSVSSGRTRTASAAAPHKAPARWPASRTTSSSPQAAPTTKRAATYWPWVSRMHKAWPKVATSPFKRATSSRPMRWRPPTLIE